MGLCEGQYGPGGRGGAAGGAGGGGGVGRRAGLIHGFALSLEPGPWLSLPEVAAGGWQCAVIPNSVSVLCLWYKYREEVPV